MSIKKNTQLLIEAAEIGDAAEVQRLILRAKPKTQYILALYNAARSGHAECVKLLIPLCDPKASNSISLYLAAQHGHAECVKLLIPVSDPQANQCFALCWATGNQHLECMRLLLQVSNTEVNNRLLRSTAHSGHVECVKLLIPFSDPKHNNSSALQLAVKKKNKICIDVLYDVSDPSAALYQLQQDHPDDVNLWGELEERVAHDQNQKLNDEINEIAIAKSVRKM